MNTIYIVINAQGHCITSSTSLQEAQAYAATLHGHGVVSSNYPFEFTHIQSINGTFTAVRNSVRDWKGLITALETSSFFGKALYSNTIGFAGTIFNDGLTMKNEQRLVVSIQPMILGLSAPLTVQEKNDLKGIFGEYGFQAVADAIA